MNQEETGDEMPEDVMWDLVQSLNMTPSSNTVTINDLLQKTFDRRQSVLHSDTTTVDRRLIFDFYFQNPEFLSFEFNLLFPKAAMHTIFFNDMGNIIPKMFDHQYAKLGKYKAQFINSLPDDFKVIGLLLALVDNKPPKIGTAKENFGSVYNMLIDITQLSAEHANDVPKAIPLYMLAKRNNVGDIVFVANVLDVHLPLPTSTTVIDTVDFLYKLMKVLNVACDPHLIKFYNFLDVYIYKVVDPREKNNVKTNERLYNNLVAYRSNEIQGTTRSNASDEPTASTDIVMTEQPTSS